MPVHKNKEMKSALITGITGQDGAYLAELLLEKNYSVHGLVRRASLPNTARIAHLLSHPALALHQGDITDAASMMALVAKIRPGEIYHLAAQSDVHASFAIPSYTIIANGLSTLTLLEAIRALPQPQACRFYQASTSELFGNSGMPLQDECTPFTPASPYSVSKLCAYWLTVNYRQAYRLYAANGILFNHESPIRGEAFVSRKITRAAAARFHGDEAVLKLGNLDAKRDWGHARDFVEGMWRILQQEQPDDYVLATGISHSVREFAEAAFACAGRELVWQGSGADERGVDANTRETLIAVDPALLRPIDVRSFRGDASKARRVLGWQPRIPFSEMVKEMVEADIRALKRLSPAPQTTGMSRPGHRLNGCEASTPAG